MPGHHHLAASAVLRILPVQRAAVERAWRLRQHRPRRDRPGVAIEPGAHRSRRGRRPDWMRQMLGLSEAWSGVINDTASTSTLVALLCARETIVELQPRARRAAGRSAAARRLHLGAQPQLGREGGAARRLRQATTCASCRTNGSYAMRPDSLDAMIQDGSSTPAAGPAPSWRRPARRRRRRSIRWPRSRASRRRTACGCTSMRPWPARR